MFGLWINDNLNMRIKEITYHKEFKLGMPNYSNITAGMHVTVELKEGEKANDNEIWDYINGQILNQTDLDPMWIKQENLKGHLKLILKIPKNGGKDKEDETLF